MNAYQEARQLLPKMPEDIFRLWFDERIDANGWPTVGLAWQGALRNKPFELWQKLEWEKRIVSLNIDGFTTSAKGIISGLILMGDIQTSELAEEFHYPWRTSPAAKNLFCLPLNACPSML